MLLENVLPATQAFSYLASKSLPSRPRQILRHAATIAFNFFIVGLSIYIQFPREWILNTPFILKCVGYLALLLFSGLKAFLLIESAGYFVHRYLQHLGFMTRRSAFVRQGQKYHWSHHMTIYPLNKQYIKRHKYIDSQNYGIPWQWVLPGFIVILLTFYTMGWKPETLVFLGFGVVYAKFNEMVHARFHVLGHSWVNLRYFRWLSDIHMLHHFDQESNFTITNPLMDLLFGTYLAPKGEFQSIKVFLRSNDLNSADFINWHYLLTEASPIEYAQGIVDVQKYPGMLKKAQGMLNLLRQFQSTNFYYEEASRMKAKMQEFFDNLPENLKHHMLFHEPI